MTATLASILNLLGLFGISAVLLVAFGFQLLADELPCPLCLLQRVAFVIVGLGFLLNVRYGSKPAHYSVILLGALFGAVVAGRQVLLHIVPGTGAYGDALFGLHFYSWAFLIFAATILAVAILFLLEGQFDAPPMTTDRLSRPAWIGMLLLFGVTLANAGVTYLQCGPGACPDNPTGYLIIHGPEAAGYPPDTSTGTMEKPAGAAPPEPATQPEATTPSEAATPAAPDSDPAPAEESSAPATSDGTGGTPEAATPSAPEPTTGAPATDSGSLGQDGSGADTSEPPAASTSSDSDSATDTSAEPSDASKPADASKPVGDADAATPAGAGSSNGEAVPPGGGTTGTPPPPPAPDVSNQPATPPAPANTGDQGSGTSTSGSGTTGTSSTTGGGTSN